MARAKRPASRAETTISWAVMGLLALIAAWVLIKQSDYDPTLFVPFVKESESPAAAVPESVPAGDLSAFLPEGMTVMSPPEAFGPETLSDKINGKAELYLSAGFLNLQSQRFQRTDEPQSWMEVFVYDMGALRRAFSVFSIQRREEAQSLGLSSFSYRTENAVFWVRGPYYVEIIASVPSQAMTEAMVSFARHFVGKTPAAEEGIAELVLFPVNDLEERSITLYISNPFAFKDLKNVFKARYEIDGEELTVFLSRQESPQEAEKLIQAYQAFLLENGGIEVPLSMDLPGARLVNILDTFELIFPHGRYVAGVHEAETKQGAEKLALRMNRRLSETVP